MPYLHQKSKKHRARVPHVGRTRSISYDRYGNLDDDNIGNRITAQEDAEEVTYAANELNQYTQIATDSSDFIPKYDAAGNQTLVKTATGTSSSPQGGYAVTIWRVTYNAQNRAVRFENTAKDTIIECAYDYMGRRFEKKVTTNGVVTLHQRYLYRDYLQIASYDMRQVDQTALTYIIWDPTQTVATCPLAIQQSGTWYTYKTPDGCKGGWTCAKHAPGGRGAEGRLRVKTADGCKAGWTCVKHAPGGRGAVGRLRVNCDLIRLRVSQRSLATPRQAKNICELYTAEGQRTTTYTPYSKVTADGDVHRKLRDGEFIYDRLFIPV